MTWCLSVLSPAYHWPLSGSPGSCLVETPGKRDGEFGCTKSCQSYQSLQQSEFDHPKILCQNPIPTGICIPVMQSALPNPYKSHIISYQIGNLPSKKKLKITVTQIHEVGPPWTPYPHPSPSASRALGAATQAAMICRQVPSTSRKRRPSVGICCMMSWPEAHGGHWARRDGSNGQMVKFMGTLNVFDEILGDIRRCKEMYGYKWWIQQ